VRFAPLAAQEPAPVAVVEVEIPATVAEKLAPTDAETVAESAVTDAEALASGDATQAEVGRDPANSLDLGATWQVAVISGLFMAILAPWTTVLLKKANIVAPDLASGANMAVAVAYYLIAWWLLRERYPNLPQDPLSWVGIAIAGAGAGQSFRSLKVNIQERQRAKGAEDDSI
jgi:hypothetical protein